MDGLELNRLTVKDVMSTAPTTIRKGQTISDAISSMKRSRVQELPVLEEDKPLGCVSYHSLLARRSLPLSSKVEQVMLPCPRLEESMLVTNAAEELMAAGVRGAPVIRAGKMIGYLSRTDLVRILPQVEELKGKKVSDFMTLNPQSVTERETIRRAQILMKQLGERALPVVDGESRLIGVIGMKGIMDALWNPKVHADPPNQPRKDKEPAEALIGSLMSTPGFSVGPEGTVEDVANKMLSEDISTMFIVEGERLVGVVTKTDLMEQIISLKPKEGVYVQITGLDEEDPDVYTALYDLIEKYMKRIDKMESPRVFTIHVSVYHHEGMRSKYSLHGRLTTTRGVYMGSTSDWSLHKTLDALLMQMERRIKNEHERMIDYRKQRPKSSEASNL